MNTKIILLITCICTSFTSFAQDGTLSPSDTLKLVSLQMKSGQGVSIVINSNIKKIGDKFTADDTITWSSIASIEVKNMRTREFLNITLTKNTPSKAKFYTEYIKQNHTRCKGNDQKEKIIDMANKLSDVFYFTDSNTLIIGSSLAVDNEHTYELVPLNSNYSSFRLYYDSDEPFLMYITKEMLEKNGIKLPCTFIVNYLGDERTEYITNRFTIKNF